MMLKKQRRYFLWFHRYLGLIAGLLFIIVGLTGSLLVFSQEIDQFFHPHLLQVEPQQQIISAQKAVEIAQSHYPDLKIHRIIVPQNSQQVYTVMMLSPEDKYIDAYINPYSGELLGSRDWKQSIGGFLIDLHVHLLAGDGGMQIVGIVGIGLLLIGITGLLLWNGWRNLKSTLKIRWRSPKPLMIYDLHKVVGVLSVAGLSLIAFTGAIMIYWTPFENLVYWLTGDTKPPEVSSQIVANRVPMAIDDILQEAKMASPNTNLWKIFPAKKPQDTFNVWLIAPEENAFNKDISLSLDQYSGKILQTSNAKESSLANRIMSAQYILHIGHYGGWLTRSLYGVIGLVPLGLLITGISMWQQRRWRIAQRHAIK